MAYGVYKVTEEFEQALAEYTGAKYAITIAIIHLIMFIAIICYYCY